MEIARRSRGTPRIAGRLLRRVTDFALVDEVTSITRAIAHRHGGEIQISNRPEGGLLVVVSLPLAAA